MELIGGISMDDPAQFGNRAQENVGGVHKRRGRESQGLVTGRGTWL